MFFDIIATLEVGFDLMPRPNTNKFALPLASAVTATRAYNLAAFGKPQARLVASSKRRLLHGL